MCCYLNRCFLTRGSTAEDATNDIINVQLPELRRRVDGGQLHVDNIDVFCEQGVFDVDQARRILTAGVAAGLAANFHGEELNCLHSAEVLLRWPHRMHEMRTIATDVLVAWCVCQSVCLARSCGLQKCFNGLRSC